jgi:hypothetical protein
VKPKDNHQRLLQQSYWTFKAAGLDLRKCVTWIYLHAPPKFKVTSKPGELISLRRFRCPACHQVTTWLSGEGALSMSCQHCQHRVVWVKIPNGHHHYPFSHGRSKRAKKERTRFMRNQKIQEICYHHKQTWDKTKAGRLTLEDCPAVIKMFSRWSHYPGFAALAGATQIPDLSTHKLWPHEHRVWAHFKQRLQRSRQAVLRAFLVAETLQGRSP